MDLLLSVPVYQHTAHYYQRTLPSHLPSANGIVRWSLQREDGGTRNLNQAHTREMLLPVLNDLKRLMITIQMG